VTAEVRPDSTHAGKNKNQQEQARPIEGSEEHQRAASPAPSFHFGEIASKLTVQEPFVSHSVYPNFSNALSLAHRLGVKPTIETVKTLEVYERAKGNTARPPKRPRVNCDEEVDIYWTSDEEDVDTFMENSAGPSSRCAFTASPLEATESSFTGYDTTSATNNTTTYVVPYVNDEFCCHLLSELDAEENLNKVSWILDSGASLHYTGDINDFIEYAPLEKPIKAATATTTSTDIIGVGTVLMTIEGSEHTIHIAPVYFIPDLSSCLLSLGVFLRRSGFTTKGDNQHITVMQNGQDFITFYPRNAYSTVYTVNTYLGAKPSIRAAEEIFLPDYETYHRRFAHPSKEVLQKAEKYVKGFPSGIQIPHQHICPGCEQGKKTNKSFPPSKTRATKPFQVIHSDLKSFPTESYHKYKYTIVFLDDYSSKAWTTNLRTKDAALPATRKFITMVETQYKTNIVEWMSDAGGEYKSKAFLELLKDKGIHISQSIPYVHQQNGRAERLIRTLTEKAETLRFQACLPQSWWEFALDYATHIYNRTPIRRLEWRTPQEWLSKVRPSVDHLRVLGCGAYIFIPTEIRENKLAPKAELMTFLGNHPGGKGYIFMRGPNNVVFSAAHATFDESMFPRCPKTVPYLNTRLREVAPPVAPCTGSTCQCPIPPQEDEESPPHQPALVLQGSSTTAEKQIDQILQDVGVTPSQRQGMRIPPPRTSAWQDRPPTPDRIKGKQRQTIPVEDTPPELPSSGLPLPLPKKHQPAALPPPREKSTRVTKVPEHYTDSNIYGEKHPVQVEKDIKRQRDWRKVVGEESSRPRRQAIPRGVPVPDSVPYYLSEEEGSDSSEGEVDDALGSPSSSGDEKVARLSQEGGVAFFNFLISKAIVTPKEKGPKEWTYGDVMGLPAGQLEEWRGACQREIEMLLKRNVFDIVERPSGRRVIKNRWVFDVKPDGRKRARLVAKGFSQVEGMDFDQIFSPIVRFETVRVRADLGGHLKYSRRWSGVRAGVLLGAQGAVHRGKNRGGL